MKWTECKTYVTMYYKRMKQYALKDRIILDNTWRKVCKGNVNLHWWMIPPSKNHPAKYNIGDYLSEVVVQWMKQQKGVSTDASFDGKTHHLYAIGSILTTSFQNATIWGSGMLYQNDFWWKKLRKLDVRCVRGPFTRDCLVANGYKCPEIYGDPAILMPLIYTPKETTKTYAYVVIPNHSVETGDEKELSTVTRDYESFIDRIVRSELVISSSLHGIILAEAYGVPAILLGSKELSLLKYQDWYQSTGRSEFPVATSVESALMLVPPTLPDLSKMQKDIMEAFPVDLWDRKA